MMGERNEKGVDGIMREERERERERQRERERTRMRECKKQGGRD